MNVINFSDARKQFKEVLDRVVNDADHTIIHRRDAEDAVLMSLEDYNGIMETLHLLSSPANAAHLAESIKQYRNNETVSKPLQDG